MTDFKFRPSVSPKLFNLNQDYPSKKRFFWSNPCEIEVMITSFTEMLELSNFGHMTTPQYNLSHVMSWSEIVGDIMVKNCDIITVISK